MAEKLLKITYNGIVSNSTKKLNAYLRMPSKNFSILRREIEMYLFQERQIPQSEIRTYWIDTDLDEIEIVNQNDYEVFLGKCDTGRKDLHLQIAAVNVVEPEAAASSKEIPTTGTAPTPATDDPSNFIIHDNVECDSCGLAPLVGFRYKCVQCDNFDLCQQCEAAHKHPQHIMVRMPTANGPSVAEAWITGPGAGSFHRRSGRRSKGRCPFAEAAGAQTAPAEETHREGRRERRHNRRHGGVLSQFMEMMMNLPESNTTPSTTAFKVNSTAKQTSSTKPAENANVEEKKESDIKAAPQSNTTASEPTKTAPTANENVSETTKAAPIAEDASKQAAEPAVEKIQEQSANDTSAKEAQPQPESAGHTPTTPVINLENLTQMVPPEYMRAGIEILNNFSEMFAKMLDPADIAAVDLSTRKNSTVSMGSTVSGSSTDTASVDAEADRKSNEKLVESLEKKTSEEAVSEEQQPLLAEAKSEKEEQRRSASFDHDWQMIDNNVSTANISTTDALINLDTSSSTNAETTTTAPSFVELGEMLRQHITEEQQRGKATMKSPTAQVDTVSTSTSTTSISPNATPAAAAQNPAAPKDKRNVPIYHTDESINAAIHAMMAMGFSNEGAWLTQLLESVNGNIPMALDIMHTSQRK